MAWRAVLPGGRATAPPPTPASPNVTDDAASPLRTGGALASVYGELDALRAFSLGTPGSPPMTYSAATPSRPAEVRFGEGGPLDAQAFCEAVRADVLAGCVRVLRAGVVLNRDPTSPHA